MPDRQLPERDPEFTLQIDTPVIDMQDLEHKPTRESRLNNVGLKIQPTEQAMYAREDEKAREAIAKLEEELKKLPPS
jgi:hypothetical protein